MPLAEFPSLAFSAEGEGGVDGKTWTRRCADPHQGAQHLRERGESLLAGGLDGRLSAVEQDIVGQLDDEPAGADRHAELVRIDHRFELSKEVLQDLRARLRVGLRLSQLVKAGLGVVQRPRDCPPLLVPLLEHRVDVLPQPLELGSELRAYRRTLVEFRLKVVIVGRSR
jgi:hypothetical protein